MYFFTYIPIPKGYPYTEMFTYTKLFTEARYFYEDTFCICTKIIAKLKNGSFNVNVIFIMKYVKIIWWHEWNPSIFNSYCCKSKHLEAKIQEKQNKTKNVFIDETFSTKHPLYVILNVPCLIEFSKTGKAYIWKILLSSLATFLLEKIPKYISIFQSFCIFTISTFYVIMDSKGK